MVRTEVSNAAIGSIIAEEIKLNNGTVLDRGSIVTDSIKQTLIKEGITDINVLPIYTEWIDSIARDLKGLSRLLYHAIKNLDTESITVYARMIVNDTANEYLNEIFRHSLELNADTFNHSIHVAKLALIYGVKDKLPLDQLKQLVIGALMHDIGKSCIPDDILNKTGRLSDKEYRLIRQHPRIGYDILGEFKGMTRSVKLIVLQHHENWDGSGYPYNKVGIESIQLSRIVRICDVYEALCARRSYKDSMTRDEVREYIKTNSGTLFEPALVDKFLRYIPKFLVGEEIRFDVGTATVVNTDNIDDPMLEYRDGQYRFSELIKWVGYQADSIS